MRNLPGLVFVLERHPVTGTRGSTLNRTSRMIHLTTYEPGAQPPAEKFPLGRVVVTPGVLAKVPDAEIQSALSRHHRGDWGEVCKADWQENESSLAEGDRLLSAYRTKAGVKFYIVTEHDRSATTVLLPEEY